MWCTMRSYRPYSGSVRTLWLLLFCCLHVQKLETTDYIYAPENPNLVSSKTVLTLVRQRVTWNEAAAICRDKFPGKGGSLAKVDDTKTTKMIKETLSTIGENAWIGLHWSSSIKKNAEMLWADMSCTEYDDDDYAYFSRDQDGHVNNKLCYYIERESGQWFQDSCRKTNFFLCQHLNSSYSICADEDDLYDEIPAIYKTSHMNGTNPRQCTSDCSSTLGCFMTWPSNNMCLFGIIDKTGSTYVKNRCVEITVDSVTATYTPSDVEEPKMCVRTDSALTGGDKAFKVSMAPVGGACSGNVATQTVVITATSSTTAISFLTYTTTVTMVQILTTTDIRTTTAVNVLTTTATTTVAPLETATIYGRACTSTPTIIVPTTVTETSVSIRPATTTYIYRECSVQIFGESSFSCPGVQTVTKETVKYLTSTDIRTTTAFTVFTTTTTETTPVADMIRTSTIYMSTTVTEISVSILPSTVTNTLYQECSFHQYKAGSSCSDDLSRTKENTGYVKSSILTTSDGEQPINECSGSAGTITETITSFDCSHVTPAAATITNENTVYARPIFQTTTITTTTTTTNVIDVIPTTVVTMATNCAVTVTTTTDLPITRYTFTGWPTCGIVTFTEVRDTIMTSTDYITLTVTKTVDKSTSQTMNIDMLQSTTDSTSQSVVIQEEVAHSNRTSDDTVAEDDIEEIQNSIVEELLVPVNNLSSTRRRKESIEDNRPTARIPGLFACALLLSMLAMLILLDIPALVNDIRSNIR